MGCAVAAQVQMFVCVSVFTCLCMQMLNMCLHLCTRVCVGVCLSSFFPHLYVCICCGVSGAVRPCSESLQECVIYEHGVSTTPILLHNVPIRDSRHCGSVHHLAAATSTPGETERKRDRDMEERRKGGTEKEEIAQCIISPSIITLCLYRGHDQIHLCGIEKKKEKQNKNKTEQGCQSWGGSVMTHTLPQPVTATTAVAIGLSKDSEFPASFLQLLRLNCASFFPPLCQPMFCTCVCFWSVSLIMQNELSGDTQANNTPGEEKRVVVVVCKNSGSHSNTHLH